MKIAGKVIYSAVLIILLLTLTKKVLNRVNVDFEYTDNLKLLSVYSEDIVYSKISDNVYQCDLATFSNLIQNMLRDNYKIEADFSTEDSIDMILSKRDEKYRLCYDKSRRLTAIGEVYENSDYPMTYITEKEN